VGLGLNFAWKQWDRFEYKLVAWIGGNLLVTEGMRNGKNVISNK
jgi:hypothetical protein